MKMDSVLYRVTLVLLLVAVAINFYIFARVTVEDPFITWRYGKNLVEAGIWGYNPTAFDLTQAYTNPIYAMLSIIPAYFRIDVVLFFKLISLVTLLLPCWLIYRPGMDRSRFAMFYLLFLALPATMVHAFSGLETFMFVVLLAGLFIALFEVRFWAVIALTLVLLFVRPEAWVLIALVPAYIMVTPAFGRHVKRALMAAAILGGVFGFYALFHYQYFGHVLPNTFYVKAGQPFNLNVTIYLLVYLLPVAALWFTPHRRLILLILGFYLPMIVSYSCADLQMNFAARFAFHIWAPVFLLMSYVIAIYKARSLRVQALAFLTTACTTVLIAHYSGAVTPVNYMLANVYPRMLEAYSAIGKTLYRSNVAGESHVFAFSDAGAAAFHSGMQAFDNLGLGSALVAHQGATDEVINQYNPDVVILLIGTNNTVMDLGNQRALYTWARTRKMTQRCDVLQSTAYILRIFSKHAITGMQATCDRSIRYNDQDESTFFYQNIQQPPWHYWHE